MSPNPSYRSGRKEEYACQRRWEAKGYSTTRSSGSHGIWDVTAAKANRKVELIQVKLVDSEATANRLFEEFIHNPPLHPSDLYHLVLEVRVKGTKDITSITV